jgi:hypothetical protein
MVETQGIDPLPGTMHQYECTRCHVLLRAFRSKKGINLRVVSPAAAPPTSASGRSADLSEGNIDKIAELMGPQPWPKGQSNKVRAELGLSRFVVACAIEQLIDRGVFKPQHSGILYAPIDAPSKSQSPET